MKSKSLRFKAMSLLRLTSSSQIHLSTNPPKRFHNTIYLQRPSFPSQIPFFTLNHIHHKNPIYLSTFHNEIQHSKHQLTAQSKSGSEPNSNTNPNSKPKGKKPMNSKYGIIPKKPKRGPRSEAVAVEDFVRNSLEKTFTSIREKNPELFDDKDQIFKEEVNESSHFDNDNVSDDEMVVDEDDPNWPIDADVGWGTRASQYFEKYPIKNLIGDDGFEIDWEGEVDDSWVQEINCLEWETFAFHPSPLIVLVFERYNRASDNWKLLKEIEKALKVYWNAKDRLPPRAVKLDINIERDLAYALKVRECPQILFLRGQKILYREKELRSADELVHMIAYFYYKAKKPSWINEADLCL